MLRSKEHRMKSKLTDSNRPPIEDDDGSKNILNMLKGYSICVKDSP